MRACALQVEAPSRITGWRDIWALASTPRSLWVLIVLGLGLQVCDAHFTLNYHNRSGGAAVGRMFYESGGSWLVVSGGDVTFGGNGDDSRSVGVYAVPMKAAWKAGGSAPETIGDADFVEDLGSPGNNTTGDSTFNGAAADYYVWSGCYTNRSGFPVIAEVLTSPSYTNTVPVPRLLVGPTNWMCVSITNGVPFTAGWHLATPPDAENPLGDHYFGPDTPAGTNSTGGGTAPYDVPSLEPGPSGDAGATASNIGQLSTNLQTAVYRGAVYIGGKVGNVEGEMVKANATLERIRTNTVPGTNGVGNDYSGVLEQIRTNTVNLGPLAQSQLSSLSNINYSITNRAGTNGIGTNIAPYMTNAASAKGMAEGAVGPFQQGVSNLTDNLVMPDHDAKGPGSTNGFAFVIMRTRSNPEGVTVNFDPEARFPGLMGIIKKGFTWLILFLFCNWCARELYELTKQAFMWETGGVPDMSVEGSFLGVGGGFNTGILIVAMVALAFILLMVTVATWFTDFMLPYFLQLGEAAGLIDFTGGNAMALYLLNSCFPVSLVLSLGAARLGLWLGGAQVVFLGASAARFLLGK